MAYRHRRFRYVMLMKKIKLFCFIIFALSLPGCMSFCLRIDKTIENAHIQAGKLGDKFVPEEKGCALVFDKDDPEELIIIQKGFPFIPHLDISLPKPLKKCKYLFNLYPEFNEQISLYKGKYGCNTCIYPDIDDYQVLLRAKDIDTLAEKYKNRLKIEE